MTLATECRSHFMLSVQAHHIPLYCTLAELPVMSGLGSLLGMSQAWGPIVEALQSADDGLAGCVNRWSHILHFGCRKLKPPAGVLC